MSSWLAILVCISSGCDPDPKTCVCKRCGRVRHVEDQTPKIVGDEYELCGRRKNGHMVYSRTQQRRYTCSRCGESYIKTSRVHEYH